ncbi:Protein flp [Orchesella cincta]|uniref:Protein flp n=1 Tax=Orchesella cincta TaxID=48709 RepID=A0A1D2N8K8_ORCCI|nr:Protein flp [Orchesella cincta]
MGIILTLPQNSHTQGQNIDPEIRSRIENFIRNVYLPATKTSSLGLSIVQKDGEVLYSTGYGYADQEKSIPNGNQTQFLIGSITKSFTSAIVIKVLSEKFPDLGEKVLDTPIRKLIPSANLTLNDRFRSDFVTFRDLLSHRTCIVQDDLSLSSEPFGSNEELLFRLRYAEEGCGFRSEFQYNNYMFALAGKLIGLISNLEYETLLQEFLIDLNMLNTTLVKKSDNFSDMPYRAQPYYVMDNVSYPFNTELIKRLEVTNAAGGLFSTPNDMARYLRFHLNLGSIDGNQVIPEDIMRWMTKPSNALPISAFKTSEEDRIITLMAYGLGLSIASYDGWQYVQHSGSFPPYSSFMSLFPEKKVGIFSNTNQGPVLADVRILHTFIYDTLIGVNDATEKALKALRNHQAEPRKLTEKGARVVTEFLQKCTKTRSQNEVIIGNYGSGIQGDIEISERFNNQTNATGLYMDYGKWTQAWLEHVEGDTYKLIWDTVMIQDFYANGDPTGLVYSTFKNGTLEILMPMGDALMSMGKFELGVSLDTLPPIPWAPDSCGPE